MQFSVKSGNPEKQRTGCVVIGVCEPRKLSDDAKTIDHLCNGLLSGILRRGDMEGTAGKTMLIPAPANSPFDRILLVGCGKERDLDSTRYKMILANTAKALDESGTNDAMSYLANMNIKDCSHYWKIRECVTSTQATLYRPDALKSEKAPAKRPLTRLNINVPGRRELKTGERAIQDGIAIANGIEQARILGDLPGNICTPRYLASQAQKLQKSHKKLKLDILDEAAMKKLGMNSLLSVSQGSKQPGRLIVMNYQGGNKKDRPIVLVGKGVTFDSGGVSIKPSAAMDEMKYDMCGAASVLGTMQTCLELHLPINLIGIIPSVENMPGSSATRPGDIVTSMSGQTIEILNTDAEGRLILCDALTYSERFNPKTVIDIATLTGACVIALGSHATGLLSNNQHLADDLLKAGTSTGDRAWQMPLWEDYQPQLDSNFADMANIGGREAGTITAACFLSRFTKKMHWAHLDIAGTAWKGGKEKGATGRPVSLLVQYLMNKAGHKAQ
ncbi:MAG: leucyl aminopeptidase [Gammaproteobacteria bacterium]|nr:leucyl aminopeptidase [Gammaproteobacteria bacterium]